MTPLPMATTGDTVFGIQSTPWSIREGDQSPPRNGFTYPLEAGRDGAGAETVRAGGPGAVAGAAGADPGTRVSTWPTSMRLGSAMWLAAARPLTVKPNRAAM